MAITAKHIEFIRLVANGETQSGAYQLSSPNKLLSKKTCEVEGSRLAKTYAIEIATERERLQKVITDAKDSSVVKEALNGILSQAEVDRELCLSISNPESPAEKLKAIDLYNKRFGSNEAIKQSIEAVVKTAPDLSKYTFEQLQQLANEGK